MRSVLNLLVVLIIVLGLASGCNNSADPFKVGVGVVNITPPVGYPHYQGISTGVRDSLYARALVFNQGETTGAILICNVIGIHRDLSRIVREKVSSETGIPFQNISIAATHTHTGPSFSEELNIYVKHEAEGKLTEEDQNGYVAFLIDGMVDAIKSAAERVKETEIKSGIGKAEGISFNRRYLLTNGRVRMNPGRLNPKIVAPAGPVDPDVNFVFFKNTSGDNYYAILSAFASHYARGIYEFSADYPGYLEERLKDHFGNQLVSVFGSGTCGNINTIDVSRITEAPEGTSAGTEWVEIVGTTIGDAINSAFPKASENKPEFKVLSRTIHLPLQGFTEYEYEWAKKGNKDTTVLFPERPFLTGFRRSKILSIQKMRENEAIAPPVSGNPWTLPVEIQVFRLSKETAIVTLPGEVFVEFGLEIKKHSPFANTMVIELANASIGYIPTLRAYSEGDYETINSRLEPGSGERMVEEVLIMLEELKNK